jgi:hypothetical protein
MKNASKLIISLLLISFIIPTLVFAQWWNPMSWFKADEVSQNLIIISSSTESFSTTTSTTTESTTSFYWWNPFTWFTNKKINKNNYSLENTTIPQGNSQKATNNTASENKPVTVTKKVTEDTTNHPAQTPKTNSVTIISNQQSLGTTTPTPAINTPIPSNLTTQQKDAFSETIQTTDTNTPSVTKNIVQQTTLKITNVSVTPQKDSATINWQTNIPTISKIFIDNSKVLNSESGLSTRHFVTVSGLSSDKVYSYEIESISESNVAKYNSSFKSDYYVITPPVVEKPKIKFVVFGIEKTSGDDTLKKFYIKSNKPISFDKLSIIKAPFSSDITEGICSTDSGINKCASWSKTEDIALEITSVSDKTTESNCLHYNTLSGYKKGELICGYRQYEIELSKSLMDYTDSMVNDVITKLIYFKIKVTSVDGDEIITGECSVSDTKSETGYQIPCGGGQWD